MTTRYPTDQILGALKKRYGTVDDMVERLGLDSEIEKAMREGSGPYAGDDAEYTPEQVKQLVMLVKDLIKICVGGKLAPAEGANDEPPPFPGRPRPGGTMDAPKYIDLEKRTAMDASASDDFAEQFPGAERIGTGYSQSPVMEMPGPTMHGRTV